MDVESPDSSEVLGLLSRAGGAGLVRSEREVCLERACVGLFGSAGVESVCGDCVCGDRCVCGEYMERVCHVSITSWHCWTDTLLTDIISRTFSED